MIPQFDAEVPWRIVRRIELIGVEGGEPPIYLCWFDIFTKECVGMYWRASMEQDPLFYGEMFGGLLGYDPIAHRLA